MPLVGEDITKIPRITRIEVAKPWTTYIEEDAQELFLAELKNPVTRVFFWFCMKHGCRSGEGQSLQLPDLDFQKGLVTIITVMDQNEYWPFIKTKKDRTLPLHPECDVEIQSFPRAIVNDFVFVLNGNPLRKEYVNATWRRARQRTGIGNTCYEDTRHSVVSQLLNEGYSATLVRKIVGHTNSKTMECYKHIKTESMRPLIERQQTVSKAKISKVT